MEERSLTGRQQREQETEAQGERRRVPFEGAKNFRDLGGYPTGQGSRTRWRLVFRSGNLHKLTPGDLDEYQRLGVRAVFDLRGDTERSLEPDPFPSVHLPVLDELADQDGAGLLRARNAKEAEDAIFRIYWGMLERRGPVFGELLTSIANPENLPALVHCTAGKDRTGIAAALLLGVLGVSRETVLEDYELTGQVALADVRSLRAALAAAGIPAEAATVVLEAPAGPMRTALDELDKRFGGTEEYLLGPAGVSRDVLERLRELLTEAP